MEFVPKKLYYKIGEVCEIAGVDAHVLRFWETEFPALTPPKTRTGQRIYRPGDIELVLEIRKLLYEDGYTIAGARKRMGMRAPTHALKKRADKNEPHISAGAQKPAEIPMPDSSPQFDHVIDGNEATCRTDVDQIDKTDEDELKTDAENRNPKSESLKRVRTELENILTLLDRG